MQKRGDDPSILSIFSPAPPKTATPAQETSPKYHSWGGKSRDAHAYDSFARALLWHLEAAACRWPVESDSALAPWKGRETQAVWALRADCH